ncbi:xanthine dehydrogenase family protein molybdopterin-binding subunit [Enterovirga aerilata]|uniref:Xanthine dehydrogenase family protein molybdopterin-binding subunit n=1 Tax=Enterovirga aerilata TaxID=2730920 RepID=A0A849I6N2_9HYPH|nr:xanthine dehydrogenase family protein molybdopterin-binding subunit [Enterovirga sp. DB1703]NNM73364.1 xanthine dehydrogenase family protein molybdopterin-binding subunit [Enterovirga sp. DB1703]
MRHEFEAAPERGRSRRRLEDERFLTGRGRFVDDFAEPGQLFGHVLRSPMAHARILAIGAAAAREASGVVAVFTGADLEAEGLGPLPCSAKVATVSPLVVPPRHALARERVRHVGDPVAFVVAETAEAARDAAELIEVTYEELPAVVDCAAALESGAPLVWDEVPGNEAFRFLKGDRAAVDEAFARAATVVEIELVNNRLVVAPLEPRAGIGRYDPERESFELILSGQAVHDIRRELAADVFRVPEEKIQLVAPDVGGGFGMKNVLHPEWVLLLFAARRLGRPVRWSSDRTEDFVSSVQGRDNHTRARLALDAEARFLALDVATVADMGAYFSSLGPAIPTNPASTAMGGVYDIPAIFMDVRGAFTNTVPVDAYRGAGKPEANYIVERLADLAARRIGISPAEIRRRNIIRSFPHVTPMGMTIEKGAFGDSLDRALAAAAAESFEPRRQDSAGRGMLRGLGLACFLETARGAPGEWARVAFEPDGTVTLLVGTQSNGQGHETSFPQIAADLLGLPVESFRYVQADTRRVRKGSGHGGARSLHQGGTAMVRAIEALLDRARLIAAQLLQASPEELRFEGGSFAASGEGRSVAIGSVAAAARDPEQLPPGFEPGLFGEVDNPLDLVTYPNGCHVAEVEIDRETGELSILRYVAVDDYGTLVNPMLTEGQVQGGLVQGIGQAAFERVVYDGRSGQLLTASLMDYQLPRAADLPPLEVLFNPVPSRANPLGVKGSGQAGCIAAPQTVMNAILDALAPLGIESFDMPATPERLWRAIRTARQA